MKCEIHINKPSLYLTKYSPNVFSKIDVRCRSLLNKVHSQGHSYIPFHICCIDCLKKTRQSIVWSKDAILRIMSKKQIMIAKACNDIQGVCRAQFHGEGS